MVLLNGISVGIILCEPVFGLSGRGLSFNGLNLAIGVLLFIFTFNEGFPFFRG